MTALRKWKGALLVYFFVLVFGIGIIEWRICSAQLHPGWVGRAPLLTLVYNWFAHPERLHYVAAVDLKAKHKIEATDLTELDPSLGDMLPARDTLVGKYLKKPVRSGRPVLPKNLDDVPPIEPSDKWMITLSVTADAKSEKALEPDSAISLVLPSNDKLEGKILTTSRDISKSKKTSGKENKKPTEAANETSPSPSPSATPEQ